MRKLPIVREPEPSAIVVYRGPSALNGAPIVAVLTGLDLSSRNPKTGPMTQLWILPAEEAPHYAVRSGADAAVCGDCPMRPSTAKRGQACYVATYQAPRSVWEHRRNQPVDLAGAVRAVRGKALRIGAYGDPAAIPRSAKVIQKLAKSAGTWTGYTHQWRAKSAKWLSRFVMASLDPGTSPADLVACHAQGWRSFRAETIANPVRGREIVCPATTAAATKCIDCRLCDGWRGDRTARQPKSIVIALH